jgi:putative hydrolase of the HAD superfamily
MPSPRFKTIFFDAAGTLFTVNGSVGETYARLAGEYGKEVSPRDLEAGFRRAFATAPVMAFPGALPEQLPMLEKQWWRTIVYGVFAPLGPFPRFEEYFDALFSYFARAEAWRLYPETIDTLTTLRARGFLLGVISNFDSRLFGLLTDFDIIQFFDPIIISTRAGSAKPDVAIFHQALVHHGLRPEEALHIGDSLHADAEGARAAGLFPVLLNRHGTEKETASYTLVSHLGGLHSIVESSM